MRCGTRAGYRDDKCRCADCKAWKSAEWLRYKASMAARGITRPNGWGNYNNRRNYAEAA